MKSKALLVVVPVAVILVGAGVYFFVSRKSNGEITSPLIQNQEAASAPAPKLLTWNDQAGFSFQYPEGLKINKHPEDNTNYANLDFYIDGKDGAVKVLAADTKYKSAVEWASRGMEVSLSGKPARKIVSPDTNEITIGLVDEGILFTIKLIPGKESYWQNVFAQIVSSFKLVYPTKAPVSNSGGASGEIIEEEEVIE